MTLPLELGAIQDAYVRRALEQIASAFPVGSANLASGLRTVRGSITGTTGAVAAGTGFTASRTGLGLYTITFTPAFSSAPSVGLGCTFGIAYSAAPTATGMSIQTFNTSTLASLDLDWSFIAGGP